MATPPSDDTRTLFKLLVDGEWHPYIQIREALAQTVPPGRALRKYEERYKQNRKSQEPIVPPISEDEQIVYGARACAQITITSWKGRGIQHRVVDQVKQIRVDPNYNGWGVILPGQDRGDEKTGGSPEVPPEDSEPSTASPAVGNEPSAAQPDEGLAGAVNSVLDSLGRRRVPLKVPERAPAAAASEAPEPAIPAAPSQSVTPPVGPSCEECGLVVSDQGRHDTWHARRAKELERPEMALLDREAMVTLMGDVMGQELEAFQKGMQGWLLQQFTQLAMAIGASQPTPSWLSPSAQRGTHRSK